MANIPHSNGTSSMRNPGNWPETLQNFIGRSFEQAAKAKLEGREKVKFQGELRNIINKAIKEKKILVNDWTKQTLPTLSHFGGQRLQLYCDTLKGETEKLKGKHKTGEKMEIAKEKVRFGQNSKTVSIPKKRNIFEQNGDESKIGTSVVDGSGEQNTNQSTKKRRRKAEIKMSAKMLGKMKKAEIEKKQKKMKKEEEMRNIVARKIAEEKMNRMETQVKQENNKLKQTKKSKANKQKQRILKEKQDALKKPYIDPVIDTFGDNEESIDVMSSEQRKKRREKRFERELQYEPTLESGVDEKANPERRFVGTCKKLEKKYLRLTSQPNPELVRPVKVLKQTLCLLVKKYLSRAHYGYLCDQLKSLRQDLTVQKVWSLFAARVYEMHSKLAIEFGDMGEFNQCQTQLKLLYDDSRFTCINKYEFYSYRILYCLLTEDLEEALNIKLKILSELSREQATPDFLSRAFAALNYSLMGDFYGFSQLARKVRDQSTTDELNAQANTEPYLFNHDRELLLGHGKWYFFYKMLENIICRERIRTLDIICNAYRQIDNSALEKLLVLDQGNDLSEFYAKHNLVGFVENNSSGGILVCHQAKPTADALFKSTFHTIDIKGQI